ncbi:MAG: DUF4097 family beta strand repeat-containing protein [Bryobacteraceae bacterium]|nr:DUF4097 family beta strand repeat-containing protein [Bryobacteraceae bacterium]MDW8379746.1 DUF4097 family beta strand repeat-containing protein [Bryobacterales bacterium]
MKPRLIAGAVLLALIWLSSCVFRAASPELVGFREDFREVHPLKFGGRLEIENFNGSVEIQGWDQESVEISATKYAESRDVLGQIRIEVSPTPDSLRIRSVKPFEAGSHGGVSYVIRAPRRIALDRIISSNGAVRLEQLDGGGRIKTSNGAVRVSRLTGEIDISTSNAAVEIDDCSAGAVVRTSNGQIRAKALRGFFEARTSNGSIDAHLLTANTQRPLRLESTNGNIRLQIDSFSPTDIFASTTNAAIELKLPASLQAQLKATTSNGEIDNQFDLRVKGTVSETRLEGTIGAGGPLIDLRSSNGSIRIQKL